MAITAAMVKELREMTGAGMMDCKKALTATDGDMDSSCRASEERTVLAKLHRRKLARIAAEGICRARRLTMINKAVVVEVNC